MQKTTIKHKATHRRWHFRTLHWYSISFSPQRTLQQPTSWKPLMIHHRERCNSLFLLIPVVRSIRQLAKMGRHRLSDVMRTCEIDVLIMSAKYKIVSCRSIYGIHKHPQQVYLFESIFLEWKEEMVFCSVILTKAMQCWSMQGLHCLWPQSHFFKTINKAALLPKNGLMLPW